MGKGEIRLKMTRARIFMPSEAEHRWGKRKLVSFLFDQITSFNHRQLSRVRKEEECNL